MTQKVPVKADGSSTSPTSAGAGRNAKQAWNEERQESKSRKTAVFAEDSDKRASAFSPRQPAADRSNIVDEKARKSYFEPVDENLRKSHIQPAETYKVFPQAALARVGPTVRSTPFRRAAPKFGRTSPELRKGDNNKSSVPPGVLRELSRPVGLERSSTIDTHALPQANAKDFKRAATREVSSRSSTLCRKEAWAEGPSEPKAPEIKTPDKMLIAAGSRARSETLTPAAMSPSSPSPPPLPYPEAGHERTTKCTREALWAACDVFWLFDREWTGEITRSGYIHALSQRPTVGLLRMLRKSDLESRFRKSAQPLSLRDWICMLWPISTEEELELMMRWAALREAWSITQSKHFRGQDSEMNRIYHLLHTEGHEEGGRDMGVALGELVRAQILNMEDCVKLFRTKDLHHVVTREAFRNVVNPHLKAKYVTNETKSKIKQEEERLDTLSLDIRNVTK